MGNINQMLLKCPFCVNIMTQKQDEMIREHQRSSHSSVMTLMQRCIVIPFHTLNPSVEMNTSLWNSGNVTLTDSNSCCISSCFPLHRTENNSSGHIHHNATELAGVSLPQEIEKQTKFLASLHLLEQQWLSGYRWCFNTRLGFLQVWEQFQIECSLIIPRAP